MLKVKKGQVIECRASRCEHPSVPGKVFCPEHRGKQGLPLKRGRPKLLGVEGGTTQVQKTGVPKVGRSLSAGGREGGDVLLPDVSSNFRVFPNPPEEGDEEESSLGEDAGEPGEVGQDEGFGGLEEDPVVDHMKTIEAMLSNDPDPELYGKKFLIPLIESIPWEELDLHVTRSLLEVMGRSTQTGSPIVRKRLSDEEQKKGYACIYCESPIEDGKWWNRTVVRGPDGIDVPIHFDSNRCYLMHFQGDQARTRAVMASK